MPKEKVVWSRRPVLDLTLLCPVNEQQLPVVLGSVALLRIVTGAWGPGRENYSETRQVANELRPLWSFANLMYGVYQRTSGLTCG